MRKTILSLTVLLVGCAVQPKTTLQKVVVAEYAFSDLVFSAAMFKDKMSPKILAEVRKAEHAGGEALNKAQEQARKGNDQQANLELCNLDVASEQIALSFNGTFQSFCESKGDKLHENDRIKNN